MAQAKLNNGTLGKDTDTFTHEERVANGSKGGIASGKSRQARRQMRETLNYLLNVPLKKGKTKKEADQIKSLDSAGEFNLDAQTMMMLSILKKAMKGDIVAATFIRDTLGENPFILAEKEKQEFADSNQGEDESSVLNDIKAQLELRKIPGVDDE
ncbi:MAG: hypothetical protein NC087_04440 [Anaeroplasma bactoclasticum]|nr:hypothetical protein [Anaeroplasma bactoclasticum]